MYKILIVEDEEIERKTLVSLLQDKFKELLYVVQASNGIEAIQLLDQEHPQILICDINLPGMNGLEVIQHANQRNKEILTLVVTSYNYFEYAHEAIRLGVEDFILKPASMEQMCNNISRLINKLDSEKTEKNQTTQLVLRIEEIKPIVESDCIHSIIQNANPVEIRKYFSLLNISPKTGFCLVFQRDSFQVSKVNHFIGEVEDLGYKCMRDSYYETHIVFLFSLSLLSHQDIQMLEHRMQKHFHGLDYLGVGSICEQESNFHDSYLSAIQNIGKPIFLEKNSPYSKKHLNDICNIDQLCQHLITDFLKFDAVSMHKRINLFYLEILYFDKEALFKVIRDFNKTLITKFNQEFQSNIDIYENGYLIDFDINNPYEDLLGRIKIVLDNITTSIENINLKSSNLLVKKALAYISLNYMKPITLNNVSAYLGVTPFYISNLLSTHTEKNFTDLVTEYRIEKSKEMLKEEKQIKEIAYELGFQSHNYFTKVFKKVTGVTPKEYKSKFE